MRLDVDGVAPFINRLEKFDKDVSKDLKKEMRAGAGEVQKAAQSLVTGQPISGWGNWNHKGRDLGFNSSRVKSGFRVQTNRYRRQGVTVAFGYDVVQANAGGSVFEVVGSGTRVSTPQGTSFVDAINANGGSRTPRTLVPAYYRGIVAARERINSAIQTAMRRVGL